MKGPSDETCSERRIPSDETVEREEDRLTNQRTNPQFAELYLRTKRRKIKTRLETKKLMIYDEKNKDSPLTLN